MKRTLNILLFAPLFCFAQKKKADINFGPVVSFYKNAGVAGGAEFVGYAPIKAGLLGAGLQVLKFKGTPKPYVPFFFELGTRLTANEKKAVAIFHIDPGYGLYFGSRGGFYFGSGFRFYTNAKLSPYLNLQYSYYSFKTSVRPGGGNVVTTSTQINAITLSAGIHLQ